MRIVVGALWLIVFIVLFAFAVNNTATVELRFFAGMVWQAPLIALLLFFFLGGVVFGFTALVPSWVRQRVEIRRLKRDPPRQASDTGVRAATSTASAEVIQSDLAQAARGARTTR